MTEPQQTNGIEMSLYDINKQACSQLAPFEKQEILKFRDSLNNFRKDGNYFLLYGREINYFTLFVDNHDPKEKHFGSTVIEILQELGDIVSYQNVDGGIEIWILKNKEATCLMLMNWDTGVVYYNG